MLRNAPSYSLNWLIHLGDLSCVTEKSKQIEVSNGLVLAMASFRRFIFCLPLLPLYNRIAVQVVFSCSN